RKRGTQKHYVYTVPAKTAIQAIKAKVAAKTYRSTRYQSPETLLAGISRALTGWAGYFRHGVSKAIFAAIDHYTWHRIVAWLRRKYKRGRSRIGMPEIRRRFCRPGTWQLACNGVTFQGAASVPVTRYRYRGSTIPAPFTPTASPHQLTAAKTRGEPGAVRAARRVRRAGRGNPPGAISAGRPGPTQPSSPGPRAAPRAWTTSPCSALSTTSSSSTAAAGR